MKRRSFLKFGALLGATSIVKPSRAGQIIQNTSDQMNSEPIVVSTWNHGLEANEGAWEVIKNNGSSLDAVEKGVSVTEADRSNRSVGIGGRPDKDGHVTLDACIMDHQSNCGAVAYLEYIEHPIQVARKIMETTPHIMLVGKGAQDFALENGFEKIESPLPEVKKEWMEWKEKEVLNKPEINHENHDTIGMLAMDKNGRISGACTTSGWGYKLPGRVGDSPIIGAGLFIDSEVGGACATGLGEAVVRIAGSHTVVELMRQGKSPQEACKLAVERIIRKHDDLTGLQVGFIALDKFGNHGAYSVYNGFDYALKTSSQTELVKAKFDRNW